MTGNTIRDWWRRKGQERGLDDLPEPAGSPPEDQWRLDYRRRVLEFVLEKYRAKAKPRDWYAFEQCMLHGRRAAGVAEDLRVTVANVYKITSRVFAKVRDLCLEYDEELGDHAIDLPE